MARNLLAHLLTWYDMEQNVTQNAKIFVPKRSKILVSSSWYQGLGSKIARRMGPEVARFGGRLPPKNSRRPGGRQPVEGGIPNYVSICSFYNYKSILILITDKHLTATWNSQEYCSREGHAR